jgi:hypothetical protein
VQEIHDSIETYRGFVSGNGTPTYALNASVHPVTDKYYNCIRAIWLLGYYIENILFHLGGKSAEYGLGLRKAMHLNHTTRINKSSPKAWYYFGSNSYSAF